jgi:hypothetical protein
MCKYKEIYWQITNVHSFFVKDADKEHGIFKNKDVHHVDIQTQR